MGPGGRRAGVLTTCSRPACPDLAEPEWPADETFNDLLRLAFKDRLVDRPDHPVVQRLAGAI